MSILFLRNKKKNNYPDQRELLGGKWNHFSPCLLVFFFPQLPQCLCIHIQRTYWHTNGIPYKNNLFIKFPEFLDMEPFLYEPLDQDSHKNGTLSKLVALKSGDFEASGSGDMNGYLDDLVTSFATTDKRRWVARHESREIQNGGIMISIFRFLRKFILQSIHVPVFFLYFYCYRFQILFSLSMVLAELFTN